MSPAKAPRRKVLIGSHHEENTKNTKFGKLFLIFVLFVSFVVIMEFLIWRGKGHGKQTENYFLD